jgi:hypothetical protein
MMIRTNHQIGTYRSYRDYQGAHGLRQVDAELRERFPNDDWRVFCTRIGGGRERFIIWQSVARFTDNTALGVLTTVTPSDTMRV